MLMAEFIAFLAVFSGGAIGARALVGWFKRMDKRDDMQEKRHVEMQNDLREALRSGDYRRLEDFLVIWGADLYPPTRDHIQRRRDELYIEDDNAKNERKLQ
jgi:hypothetical protein